MANGHKGPLRIAIEDFIETYLGGDLINKIFAKKAEDVEHSVLESHDEALDELFAILDKHPDETKILRQALSGENQGGLLAAGGFGAQLGMSAASSLIAPIMRIINYSMDSVIHTARPDPSAAFAMFWRDPTYVKLTTDYLSDLGWTDEMVAAWESVLRPTLSEGDLLTLHLREELPESDLRDELTARGWTSEKIDNMLKIRQIIPGVTDLISMAVREAWNPETIERFNYMADFPEPFAEWAEKQGLSRDWAEKYWISHWTLPGISAGYQMLHRLRPGEADHPFTLEDMRLQLRTADIPEFFRDRLIDISYATYTRVDVRRMYKAGVLTEDEVYTSYLDLGYDEEHARNLADFAMKDATSEQRDLTRSAIIGGYKRGMMSTSEAESGLISIGYSAADAAYYVSMADYDLAQKQLKVEIDRVEFLYLAGELTQSQVYSQLGQFNMPSKQLADLIGMWDAAILKKTVLPSRGDLEDFYKRDLIDYDTLRKGFIKRRYRSETVDLYLNRLDQVIAEDAAKEAERAQKEQERLARAEQSTVYQQGKASYDVQIAYMRLQIADDKVALHEVTDPDEQDALKVEILEIKRAIATVQVQKAQLREETV